MFVYLQIFLKYWTQNKSRKKYAHEGYIIYKMIMSSAPKLLYIFFRIYFFLVFSETILQSQKENLHKYVK